VTRYQVATVRIGHVYSLMHFLTSCQEALLLVFSIALIVRHSTHGGGIQSGKQQRVLQYKKHEADAFKIIFRDTSYKTWRLEWILHNAKQTVPSLDKKQLNAVIDHLKQASELRKKHSLRYQHAPLQERTGHDYWSQLIKKNHRRCQFESRRGPGRKTPSYHDRSHRSRRGKN
jgi:hypothetical protein